MAFDPVTAEAAATGANFVGASAGVGALAGFALPVAAALLDKPNYTWRNIIAGSDIAEAGGDLRDILAENSGSGKPAVLSPEQLLAMSTQQSKEMLDAQIAASKEMAQFAREMFPGDSKLALNTALEAAGVLDQANRTRMTDLLTDLFGDDAMNAIYGEGREAHDAITNISKTYLEDIMPGMMQISTDLFNQAGAAVSSLISGTVPEETALSIRRSLAETMPNLGIAGVERFGKEFSRNIASSSLAMTLQGLQAAPGVLGMASGLQGLVSGSASIAGLPIQSAQAMMGLSQPFMAGMPDLTSLYGAHLSTLTTGTMIPATNVLAAGVNLAGTTTNAATNLALGNQQMQTSMYVSDMNYRLGQQQLALAQQQASAAQQSSLLGGLGSLLGAGVGAATGGWGGAFVGSQVGGSLGGLFG